MMLPTLLSLSVKKKKNIALSLVFCQKEDSLETYLHHTEKKIHRQLQELGLKTWRNKKKDYFKDTPWSSMIDRRRANLKIFLDAGEDQDKGMNEDKEEGWKTWDKFILLVKLQRRLWWRKRNSWRNRLCLRRWTRNW